MCLLRPSSCACARSALLRPTRPCACALLRRAPVSVYSGHALTVSIHDARTLILHGHAVASTPPRLARTATHPARCHARAPDRRHQTQRTRTACSPPAVSNDKQQSGASVPAPRTQTDTHWAHTHLQQHTRLHDARSINSMDAGLPAPLPRRRARVSTPPTTAHGGTRATTTSSTHAPHSSDGRRRKRRQPTVSATRIPHTPSPAHTPAEKPPDSIQQRRRHGRISCNTVAPVTHGRSTADARGPP